MNSLAGCCPCVQLWDALRPKSWPRLQMFLARDFKMDTQRWVFLVMKDVHWTWNVGFYVFKQVFLFFYDFSWLYWQKCWRYNLPLVASVASIIMTMVISRWFTHLITMSWSLRSLQAYFSMCRSISSGSHRWIPWLGPLVIKLGPENPPLIVFEWVNHV